MKHLVIQGKKEKIPSHPHHKEYIYRSRMFFLANNLYTFFAVNGLKYYIRKVWLQHKYKIPVPYVLLIDPTTACNLKCIGCWAADYGRKSEISYEKLDQILTEAKKLGIDNISFTGGDPLMRKNDLLKLFKKHRSFPYTIFTNATLIDEEFAAEIARLGNVTFLISVEGYRENTDFRRGKGTFDKVMDSMDLLKKHGIAFGFSICYHSKNYEEVSSDGFLDFLRDKGAWFGWMINYMPIGKGADVSLCLNAEQRKFLKDRIDAYVEKHQFTIVDFSNNGHKAYGCVAAGDGFLHINAAGDVEPCAFFHYSDVNIHNVSLAEALASPFLTHFREQKIISDNPHRPCPIMDVPDALLKITDLEGVCSTHLHCHETPSELYAKTKPLADGWKPVADKYYQDMSVKEKERFKMVAKYLLYRDSKNNI